MKIVHIVGYFVPELGYQEYYLAKKQAALGHEVHIITSDMLYPFPDLKEMLRQAGIKNTSRKRQIGTKKIEGVIVHRLPHLLEYSDLILVKGIAKTLRRLQPDAVVVHESRQSLGIVPAHLKKELKYQLTVDHHDFYHTIPGHPLIKKIARYLDYRLIRRWLVDYTVSKADAIVGVTNESKRFLVEKHGIPGKKIKVIPLGVDEGAYRFNKRARGKIRKRYHFSARDVVLIFSGTIVRRKSVELLIRALANVSDNIKALIVGTGEKKYMDELKKLAVELNVEQRCIFSGFVNKKELPAYFSAADIGVWPGNNSISIIEAMACSLPIIMVDLQLTHLVGYKNGIAFPEKNLPAFVAAIKKIAANNKMKKEMGNNSRKVVEKKYGYERIAKAFLTLARSKK